MNPIRVMVFDQAASIRALLKRTVEESDNLVCVGSHPTAVFLENDMELESVGAMIIGFDQNEVETMAIFAASLARLRIPAVVLIAGEGPARGSIGWPEDCVILGKPLNPQGWEGLCASLAPTLEGMENGNRGHIDQSERIPRGLIHGLDFVAVGGSAGGPEATGEMLQCVGEALEQTAVAIVQHIGAGFETEYVQWLGRILPWADIGIAQDGEPLSAGQIRLAGPGVHLEISEGPVCRFDRESPPFQGHRPSVDHLFQSLARSKPVRSAGVLLSGMGIDGVEGLLSLRRAGCLTLAQDQASSTVFGMPGSAITTGAALIAQPPAALGTVLRSHIERGRDK